MEDLLAELMAELGVTDEQFVASCEKAAQNPLHKKIVDQIMAVDNFLAFKRLMVKRNQELNKQAIEMMKRKAAGPVKKEDTDPKNATKPTEEVKEEVKQDAKPTEAK